MDRKIMAVAVVAIVVIAGIGAVIALGGEDGGKSYGASLNQDSRLTIFGNANGDDYLDQRDVDAVRPSYPESRRPNTSTATSPTEETPSRDPSPTPTPTGRSIRPTSS